MNKIIVLAVALFATIGGSVSAQFKMSDGAGKVGMTMSIVEKLYVDDKIGRAHV